MTQASSVKIDLGHNGTRALEKAWLSWGDPRLAQPLVLTVSYAKDRTNRMHTDIGRGLLQTLNEQIFYLEHSDKLSCRKLLRTKLQERLYPR